MKATQIDNFSYLVKQLPKPVALVNTSFEITYVSDTWNIFFETSQNMIGNSITTLFPHHYGKLWNNQLQACFEGKTTQEVQTKLAPSGVEEWFEWTGSPWYDANENIIGAMVQIQDITERRAQEQRYERLLALMRAQSEITKVGTWEYTVATEALTWSEMTKKIYEVPVAYTPNIDDTINFFKRGHSRNTLAMLTHNALHKGAPWNKKLQLVTAKGNAKWVIAAGKPLYKNGKVHKLIGTLQDVTERVQQEIKTEENEQLLRTLIDNLPLNVYIKDKDSKKVLVNRQECDYLEVEHPSDLVGRTDFDLYEYEVAKISREEDLQVMKTQQPILGKRTRNTKPNGAATDFLTSKIPLLNIDGSAKGLIGLSMDISDLVQKENELGDLINVTAEQNKKLINFAHIVSHNLRSHTANLSMLLDFLTKEEEESEKGRIMTMLTKASDNLMDTLENLNEVVDINTNVNVEKKSLNLNDQIKRVQENLAAFLQQHKAKINSTIASDVYVSAVPAYLESIILNLLTNAVKYRHKDRRPAINLTAKKQNGYLIFSVSDNGLGIDMQKYGSKLFGMYKTFHKNTDARGIGLYLTKNQIEAMGGSIMACSEVGQGSTFSIYFKDED